MNYKYNEETYAKKIFNEGFQTDFIKFELILLTKYLKQVENYTNKDTKIFVKDFCKKYLEDYNEVLYYNTIDSAIKEGRKQDNKLIQIKSIPIYHCEVQYLDDLNINYDYKKILLSFLVNKKINHEVMKIKNGDIKNKLSIYFDGTTKKYNQILKQSNLNKKYNINLVINELMNLYEKKDDKLILSLVKGNILLQFIEKIKYDKVNNEVFYKLPVQGFENIGWIFDYYKEENNIKRCKNCGVLIQGKSNKKIYCSSCADEIKKEKDKERMRKKRNSRK